MFEPPSAQEILPDVAEALRHFGHLQLHAVFWLAEKLSEHWNDNPERILVQKYPEVIADFSESEVQLSFEALELIVRRAIQRWYLAREYSRCRRDLASQFFFPAVEILTRRPRVCCDAALALNGRLFRQAQDLPTLPLPNCNFRFCGCDYHAWTHAEFKECGG
jgi:hypothetical protein